MAGAQPSCGSLSQDGAANHEELLSSSDGSKPLDAGSAGLSSEDTWWYCSIEPCSKFKMPIANDLKKQGRGFIVEKVAVIDNIKIGITTWFDNKPENMLSTYVGSDIRRYPVFNLLEFTIGIWEV
ncbi:hypothetical protein JTB14_027126 [Gonioctena quinquepunctata]|nr:hypothetical protein JTB14_027126 [Gonioctena quinquepunctata]